jgi:hypothetical protein
MYTVDFDSPSKAGNLKSKEEESAEENRNTEANYQEDELNMTIHDMEFGRRNVGIWGTAFNIFKCFIGIGLLALPSAFHHVNQALLLY